MAPCCVGDDGMIFCFLLLIWVEVEGGRMENSIYQTISSLPSHSDRLAAALPLLISVFVVDGRWCHVTMMMYAVAPRKLKFPSLAGFIGAAGY